MKVVKQNFLHNYLFDFQSVGKFIAPCKYSSFEIEKIQRSIIRQRIIYNSQLRI